MGPLKPPCPRGVRPMGGPRLAVIGTERRCVARHGTGTRHGISWAVRCAAVGWCGTYDDGEPPLGARLVLIHWVVDDDRHRRCG